MKVTLLEPSGFCTGVERAIKIALETKNQNPDKEVVVLGMLVHNSEALKKLEDAGIHTFYDKNCSLEELAHHIGNPDFVILTAHGHSRNVEDILNRKGIKVIDATCPFVKQSFKEIFN